MLSQSPSPLNTEHASHDLATGLTYISLSLSTRLSRLPTLAPALLPPPDKEEHVEGNFVV
ncbi:hypothetical protein L195_g000924 [Trifolium pratense]|uniref:Uncharacterized protein n=1 Tax=Trifolium pratense TaxID=57577 RepID=A0A2K3NNA1_TRIPR|nr:hypothetical protein L195_g000924 [Trifolium pratense]